MLDPFTGEEVREPTPQEIAVFVEMYPQFIQAGFSLGLGVLKTIVDAFDSMVTKNETLKA